MTETLLNTDQPPGQTYDYSWVSISPDVTELSVSWADHISKVRVRLGRDMALHLTVADARQLAGELLAAVDAAEGR